MESKIKAELKRDRIMVNAKFYEGSKKVHEINTAFPSDTVEKDIKEEVKNAGKLYEIEKEQKVEQKKVDKLQDKANKVITNLNK